MDTYEKKYKEALKAAFIAYKNEDRVLKATLKRIFPELKESGDERIRKELLSVVNDLVLPDEQQSRFIAWLEKKGEQKPESITDEWIENYWQHEKVNNPYSYDKGDEIQFDHQGFVRFCKKYCKKPSEWSEEDEKFFKTALWHISYSISNGKSTDIHCDTTEWLKSLKDRVHSQDKWKPSDEQLKALDYVCHFYNPPATEKNAWDSLKNIEIMYGQLKKLTEE